MRRLFPSLGPRPASTPLALQLGDIPMLEAKGDIDRRATSGGPYVTGGGVPYRSTWSSERAVTDGLERVTWVYTCINAIASDESRLPITWRQDHPEKGDEIKPEAEPLWKLLNRRANKWESAGHFRYRLSMQLLLSKQGVFVEIERARDGTIIGLYLLPPHRTAPMPDPDKFVSGFQVYGSGGEIYTLEPERVLWIRRPHPLDPYMGLVPMEAAGLAIDVDFYARLYNRNFMMNDGRPGGVLNVKGFLSDEDANELQARFSGGPGSAGKVTILEADGVEYVDTSTTARDMQHADTRTATKKEILMAFGVPETRAGDSSGRTFDNADAEMEMYWRDTMRAHNDIIDSAFDSITAGGIDDNIFTVHDTTGIYVLSRDEKDKESRFQALWTAGLISADEFRAGTGRDPVKRPGSKVLWVTNQAKIPVGKEADEKLLNDQMSGGAGGAGAPGGPPGAGAGADTGAGAVPTNGSDPNYPGDPNAGQNDWWNNPGSWQSADTSTGNGNGSGNLQAADGSGSSWAPDQAIVSKKADPYLSDPYADTLDPYADPYVDPYAADAYVDIPDSAPPAPADPPVNTGIMVSLDVPGDTARSLLDVLLDPDLDNADDSEDPEDLHLTLSYLGKVDAATFSAADVLEAVQNFADMTAPIDLAVSGIGHFSIPEGTATYASIDSPDLPDFRARLVANLTIKDVVSPSAHGFSPHVTLAYTPAEETPPDAPIEDLAGQLDDLAFTIDEISVHWGDDIYRFPLTGVARDLAATGAGTYSSGE